MRTRIQKPASAKQRANTRRIAIQVWARTQFPAAPIAGAPPTSWWTGRSREELAADVASNQLRIRNSKFGLLLSPGTKPE